MLKKTLIALAALSGLAVMIPAQAQGWERGHQEARHSQPPQIGFVVYRHAERSSHHRHRHHGHHQYRHHDHGQGHYGHRR